MPTSQDRLQIIFDHQRELAHKFRLIESDNGFHVRQKNVVVTDFDNPFSQAYIKDHVFRVIEEVHEAIAAYNEEGRRYVDELADVYHFLVELFIICGLHQRDSITLNSHELMGIDLKDSLEIIFDFAEKAPKSPEVELAAWELTDRLLLACNLLKNRPWKQSRKPTNVKSFKAAMGWSHLRFVILCHSMGLTADELYQAYMGKHEENQKRIGEGV